MAEVPATLKDFSGKRRNETTFILDNNKLTEIQVSGKSKTIGIFSLRNVREFSQGPEKR